MIRRDGRSAPFLTRPPAVFALALALAGCSSMSILRPPAEPVAIASTNPERAAAIADMRAQAEAGDAMPFPDVYQTEQTNRLALRGEPRSIAEVQAIEAELTVIAERRAATTDPREIAALDKRAKELRRLALASQALRE
jgi:hypothetical protein